MVSDDEDDLFGEMMEAQLLQDEDLDHPSTATSPAQTLSPTLLSKPSSYFQARPAHGLVGLQNQGATCYLNSLLQALFLTPEFRQALFDLDETDIGVAAYEEEQRAKGDEEGRSAEGAGEGEEANVEVSEMDVQELVSMGFDEAKVRRGLAQFPSPAQREQAIDCILALPDEPPPSTDPPAPTASASSSMSSSSPRPYRRIPIAFRLFFSQLQLLDHASLATTLITSAFGWTNASIGVQHDIHELFTRLCEAMEGSLKGLRGHSLISSLFCGSLRRTLTCEGCSTGRERHEDFYSLHLPIGGCPTIHAGLAKVFESEKLSLGCDECGGRRPTASSSSIARFPFLLTFALGRHEYDRAKGVRVKLGDDFAFPLVLDMQMYGDGFPADARQRREKELTALRTPGPERESNGKRRSVGGEDSDDCLLLPSHFDAQSPQLYDLFAVVVHAGSAHSGHYFAYIRDVLKEAEQPKDGGWWWKCNDNLIAPMDVGLIASQYGGKKESAYMLMYRKRTLTGQHPPLPAVPAALVRAANEYNAQLDLDRAQYDEFRHAVRLVVWLEKAILLKGDRIVERERDQILVAPPAAAAAAQEKKSTASARGKANPNQGKAGKGGRAKEKSAKQQRQEEEHAMEEDQRRARELIVAEADDARRDEERRGKFTFVVDERLPIDAFYSLVKDRLRWGDADRDGDLRLNRAERAEDESEEEGRRLEGSLPYHGMRERDEERIPSDHLHLEPDAPIRQSLADVGVRHGDVLLAWNGRSLHGHPLFTGIKRPKRQRFSVRWVRDDTEDVVEFVCYLPAEATVRDMVELVRRRVGSDGVLHLFLLTKRALTPIDLSSTHVRLADVDVTDNCVLVLELTPHSPSSSPSSFSPCTRAMAYFHSQSSRVKLIVQDRLSSASAPSEDLTLRVEKSVTLSQLKRDLLQLHPGVAEGHCRLRKINGTDRIGAVLDHEAITLLEAELDDDDVMVRLECGELPRSDQLDLVVSFIDDGVDAHVTVLEQQPLLFEKRWTVKQMKQHVLEAARDRRPESGFLLYRGNAAGVEKDKLLANEFVTLDRLHLNHGDTLFLHVGELPMHGKVTLDVFLYTPSLFHADVPSLPQLLHKYEHGEEQKEREDESAVLMASSDAPLESPASTLDMATRSSLLSFLLTLPFSSAASLLDLKTAIHSLSSLSSLPSPSHLRVRALNKADELHSLLTDDALPLKRQGVSTDRRLAVQVLGAPEANVLPSALLLRLVLVVPHKTSGCGVQVVPAGGVELLFSVSMHPQVEDLREWAARQVAVAKTSVVLVKWISGGRCWRVLSALADSGVSDGRMHSGLEEVKRPPSTEPVVKKDSGTRNPTKAVVPSLLTAPYHLHQQGQRRPSAILPHGSAQRRSTAHSAIALRYARSVLCRSDRCAACASVSGVRCVVVAGWRGGSSEGGLRSVAVGYPACGRGCHRRRAPRCAQGEEAGGGGADHRLLSRRPKRAQCSDRYIHLRIFEAPTISEELLAVFEQRRRLSMLCRRRSGALSLGSALRQTRKTGTRSTSATIACATQIPSVHPIPVHPAPLHALSVRPLSVSHTRRILARRVLAGLHGVSLSRVGLRIALRVSLRVHGLSHGSCGVHRSALRVHHPGLLHHDGRPLVDDDGPLHVGHRRGLHLRAHDGALHGRRAAHARPHPHAHTHRRAHAAVVHEAVLLADLVVQRALLTADDALLVVTLAASPHGRQGGRGRVEVAQQRPPS